MRDLFEGGRRPEWLLLIICDNREMLHQQQKALSPYRQHFTDRDLVIVTVSPDDANVAHGDLTCGLNTRELVEKYNLELAKLSYVLVNKDDCVKWAAPTPCCIEDIMLVIDEMPLHDKENAARGPAPLDRNSSPSFVGRH